MWIVNLTANANGSHNDHNANHITTVPEGHAMIPEGFEVPSSFPFVTIEAEEVTHYREIEVIKDVPKQDENGDTVLDELGNPIMETKPVTEQVPYTCMTVTKMTAGEVPPAPAPEPTQAEQFEAQLFYTAMMTDTLLTEDMPMVLAGESAMYSKIHKWYKQRLWTAAMVSNAVKKNLITPEEYKDITGNTYEN